MSGVRQTKPITCTHCGANGVVKLGMAMITAIEATRDFECSSCGGVVSVSAPRAILDLDWEMPSSQAGRTASERQQAG